MSGSGSDIPLIKGIVPSNAGRAWLSIEFLAAMSSSRSDVVTQFVRSFVTNEFFLSPKRFNGVSRKVEGCLKF